MVTAEAKRLERLWGSAFGEAYTQRNATARYVPGALHAGLARRLGAQRILEVGCNLGLNLTELAAEPGMGAFGVDVCAYALQRAAQRIPRARLAQASAYALPFPDGAFDLVFTCGVLIHLNPDDLPRALAEIRRTTRRYLWLGEYFSSQPEDLPYRGETGALFKRDFGAAVIALGGGMQVVESGFLERAESGYDDLTWWLLEKS